MEEVVSYPKISNTKKWMRLLLSYGITIFFIYLLIKNISLPELASSLSKAPIASLIIALIALTIAYVIRSIRWGFMLQALNSKVRVAHCISPFVISMAINNVLPLRAGDMMRLFGFRRLHNLKPEQVLGTLVLERLLDLLMILGLFYISLPWVIVDALPNHLIHSIKIVTLIAAIILLGVIVLPAYAKKLLNRLTQLRIISRSQLYLKIFSHLHSFINAIQLIRSTKIIFYLIGLSAFAWVCEGSIYLIAAHAFHYQGPPIGPYFASTLGALSTLLPSSPGYVGTFDYFTTLGLQAFGIDLPTATATTVLTHLILWLPVIIAGFTFYFTNRLNRVPEYE